MNIKGRIIKIGETTQVTDSFKKREFVIEYMQDPNLPQYSETPQLELIQDKCDQLDNVNIGDEVDVFFNIKGRKWTNTSGEEKYFTSLQAWKIEVLNAADVGAKDQQSNNDEDDLPF